MITDPKCFNCRNLTPKDEEGFFYCKAFPNKENRTDEEIQKRVDSGIIIDPKGIPDEIILGENDHTEPCCGQVGDFIYTPKEK